MKRKLSGVLMAVLLFSVFVFSACSTVAVTGVELNKTALTLIAGENETLTATVAPSGATTKTVTWKSSDETVATVDSNGKVVAVAEGDATITVTTTDGNKTATCAVTVNPKVAVTGVTLDKSTLVLAIGSSQTLTATVAPADASYKTVTWSTSNPAVATVTNGTVTAASIGTAEISATSTDGSFIATCNVTVTLTLEATKLANKAILNDTDLLDGMDIDSSLDTAINGFITDGVSDIDLATTVAQANAALETALAGIVTTLLDARFANIEYTDFADFIVGLPTDYLDELDMGVCSSFSSMFMVFAEAKTVIQDAALNTYAEEYAMAAGYIAEHNVALANFIFNEILNDVSFSTIASSFNYIGTGSNSTRVSLTDIISTLSEVNPQTLINADDIKGTMAAAFANLDGSDDLFASFLEAYEKTETIDGVSYQDYITAAYNAYFAESLEYDYAEEVAARFIIHVLDSHLVLYGELMSDYLTEYAKPENTAFSTILSGLVSADYISGINSAVLTQLRSTISDDFADAIADATNYATFMTEYYSTANTEFSNTIKGLAAIPRNPISATITLVVDDTTSYEIELTYAYLESGSLFDTYYASEFNETTEDILINGNQSLNTLLSNILASGVMSWSLVGSEFEIALGSAEDLALIKVMKDGAFDWEYSLFADNRFKFKKTDNGISLTLHAVVNEMNSFLGKWEYQDQKLEITYNAAEKEYRVAHDAANSGVGGRLRRSETDPDDFIMSVDKGTGYKVYARLRLDVDGDGIYFQLADNGEFNGVDIKFNVPVPNNFPQEYAGKWAGNIMGIDVTLIISENGSYSLSIPMFITSSGTCIANESDGFDLHDHNKVATIGSVKLDGSEISLILFDDVEGDITIDLSFVPGFIKAYVGEWVGFLMEYEMYFILTIQDNGDYTLEAFDFEDTFIKDSSATGSCEANGSGGYKLLDSNGTNMGSITIDNGTITFLLEDALPVEFSPL